MEKNVLTKMTSLCRGGGGLENFQFWEKVGLKIFEFLGEGEGKMGALYFFQVRGGGKLNIF